MPSIFSKIINGELPGYIIWKHSRFVALLDIKPINPGHTLLMPLEQIDSIYDLSDVDYQDIWKHVRILARAIQKATQAKRIGIAVEGFGVSHAHIHLVPVNQPEELDPHRAKAATANELSAMSEKIKLVISESNEHYSISN